MLFRRPLRLLVVVAATVAGVLVVTHATSSRSSGRELTLLAPSPAATVAGAPGVLPVAPPSSTPVPDAGPAGMLQTPLRSLFQQLNADTKSTANGEYSLLQQLEQGLRERIEQFLRWVTGGR